MARQRALKQLGVEFELLPVGVDVGSREARSQQRRPELRRAGEQAINPTVLKAAQLALVEPGRPQQARRIDVATVWRRDDQRRQAGFGLEDLDGRA
jgi:hypothetical protein